MTATAVASDIGARFDAAAKRLGGKAALIHRGETTSWTDLAAEVEALAKGFVRSGLKTNDRVAVLVPPSREFFAAAFALFRSGATPVLIDPGIGFANMGRCLAEAEPVAFVGSPKAHLARVLGRWAPSARMRVASAPFFGLPTLADVRVLGERGVKELSAVNPEGRAGILFTSGSTGAPKGVVYEHRMFDAQIALLKDMFGIEEGDASVATFPLFALFDLALGQTVVLPEMDFTRPGFVDPLEIVGACQKHRARQLFGSPALLDRVGRYGERHGIALPDLKRVMSAGAPVPAKTLARFGAMLEPGTPIHTPYGATEALPVALTDSREILTETARLTADGKGTCVGKPVNGLRVEVIGVTDEPIKTWSDALRAPEGEVGEICVKGPQVTVEYFRRPEDMAKAKIGDGDGHWHRMGDLGYFDEKGRLWFCGRKAHRVGRLFTDPVEGVFNAVEGVRRTALLNVNGKPVLCVEKENDANETDIKRKILDLARSTASTWVNDTNVLFHDAFPVDIRHNAKIFREKLAVWAEGRL